MKPETRIFNIPEIIQTDNFINSLSEVLSNEEFVIAGVKPLAGQVVLIADQFLMSRVAVLLQRFPTLSIFYREGVEPSTEEVNSFIRELGPEKERITCLIAIGGGSTLDFGKAVSNMITNTGLSEDYQGWDLVKVRGCPKIGIPTLFGTGAETSKTCVLLNPKKRIKLGMNSRHSLFDVLVLESKIDLTASLNNRFFTAMDAYFHAIEILRGRQRSAFTDSFASVSYKYVIQGIELLLENKDAEDSSHNLMLGSYFGGIALANGLVGVIHPISAALSSCFGIRHGEANCLSALALGKYYPDDISFVRKSVNTFRQITKFSPSIDPFMVKENLDSLISSTLIHEKPLENHLGGEWRLELNSNRLEEIFMNIALFLTD